jgi:hypothetical protein
MPNPTVLVTIKGPRKTVDLELPSDVPVNELISLLLEICGPVEGRVNPTLQIPICLKPVDADTPLESTSTFVDAKIFDGAILALQINDQASRLVEQPIEMQFVPKSIQPGLATGGIGVTWSKERL